MTYCLAIAMEAGLVFVSDSRTNAGVDNVSTYSKMHTFNTTPDRQIVILAAGNLATTQGVIDRIENDLATNAIASLNSAQRFSEVVDYVGKVSVNEQQKTGGGPEYEVSLIVGGQINGEKPLIMLVYPQGNHIATSDSTPFLQIGESKYGKPILDRIISSETKLETAVLCGLVSMDSTMRSNLTVGPPIEVLTYRRDSFQFDPRMKFDDESEYLRQLKRAWDEKLKESFNQLPPLAWVSNWDDPNQVIQSQQTANQPAGTQQQMTQGVTNQGQNNPGGLNQGQQSQGFAGQSMEQTGGFANINPDDQTNLN